MNFSIAEGALRFAVLFRNCFGNLQNGIIDIGNPNRKTARKFVMLTVTGDYQVA